MTKTETQLIEPLAPKRTRLQEFWRLFRKNRLAILGMILFVLFFFTALIGLFLTSGHNPVFDPALIRLQEKLRPPLADADLATLQPDEIEFISVMFDKPPMCPARGYSMEVMAGPSPEQQLDIEL